jgi:hypothetical protein
VQEAMSQVQVLLGEHVSTGDKGRWGVAVRV